MRRIEIWGRAEKPKECRAKAARRTSRFIAQGLRSSETSPKKVIRDAKIKPSAGGDCVATDRGRIADAFFGASPVVASVLGVRLGATPRGRNQATTAPPGPHSKPDISTLP